MKKGFALLCILLLSFTATVTAAPPAQKEYNNQGKQNQKNLVTLKKEQTESQYASDDNVRVLVEMKEEPAITVAQKQGKRYKNLAQHQKKQLKDEKLSGQKKVKAKAKEKKVKLKELEEFTTVINGFSAEIPFGEITKLKEISEVNTVHIVNEYERPKQKPDMVYSKEIVQAQEAWRDYGYDGNGMIIGIIDTGVDPSHRDMVLSEDTTRALTKETVTNLKNTNGLNGNYYTEKVPYGFNYMDDNHEILDLGPDASMHGMHVAGTAGANGNEQNGGIKGIAPEAQILALKVFGNDPNMPSTWGDIYVKAIDEAIVLGADVLNLSLGSTAGFVSDEDPEQQAVKRAVDNGIMMSISAGNSAHFGNGFANPLAANPDIGVSGAPGISTDSMQVASIENNFLDLNAAEYSIDDETGLAPFLSASSVEPESLGDKGHVLIDGGLGTPEELAAVDVKGKFALIQRGGITFVEKAVNAQAAGASGVIIFNNADGYISMATEPQIQIPQLFMLKSDGEKFRTALSEGKSVALMFNGQKTKSANPEAGKMSAFTSWGVTPNLDFKPEITAPGGQIYSTLNDDQYGMMSGTSMAAPHAAGGSALVLQRVDEEFKTTGADRVNLAKNIMMNTAKPLVDKGTVNDAFSWDVPYSPRRQGAGVMQLHSALATPVTVTEVFSKAGKVALKEVGNKFKFTLKAENHSSVAVEYDVSGNIQTDFAAYGEFGWSANVLEAQNILDASITINGTETTNITVPASGSVQFEVAVDLSNAKVIDPSQSDNWETPVAIDTVFPNGYFVEGYVTLKDGTDLNPELNVPYVGFKGKWDQAPILDGTKYDESSFYGMAGAVSNAGEDFGYLGYNPVTKTFSGENVAISPNADGVQDNLIPILSFLRNAKKVEYSVVDEAGKSLRKLRTDHNVTKNYYDSGSSLTYSLNPAHAWDGKLNNVIAKDGQYYYEVKAVIDFQNAQTQSYKIPVLIDTVAPSLTATAEEDVLILQGADNVNGSGLAYFDIQVDGKSILESPLDPTTNEYPIPESAGEKWTVIAVDFAGNQTIVETELEPEAPIEDKTVPSVFLVTPEALSVTNKKEVTFSGHIVEPSGLKEFTIDGKTVKTVYNDEKKHYEFSYSKKYKDGVHSAVIAATDKAGNAISFRRQFIIDTKAPKLDITGLPKKNKVGEKDPNPKVNVKITDNFDEIRLYLNGSELYYNEFKEPYQMREFEEVIKAVELPLELGKNIFVFEVTDLGGNTTAETVTITKEAAKKPKK